jgi:hypothetical protein
LDISNKGNIFAQNRTVKNMALKIISAKDFSVKLKATIHSSGRLGFTEATAKELNFTKDSAVKFAVDEVDESVLYLINCKEADEEAFKVNSAGLYFSVNAKPLFDSLGYEYKKKNIMFDMVREKEIEDMEVYKLLKREKQRKQKTE